MLAAAQAVLDERTPDALLFRPELDELQGRGNPHLGIFF